MTRIVIEEDKLNRVERTISINGISCGKLSVQSFEEFKRRYPHCFVRPRNTQFQNNGMTNFYILTNP